MMSEVGPVFIRSCLAQANFECDDIVTIDRYEPDALAICWPIYEPLFEISLADRFSFVSIF